MKQGKRSDGWIAATWIITSSYSGKQGPGRRQTFLKNRVSDLSTFFHLLKRLNMKIYISNLDINVSEQALFNLFISFGTITAVTIIRSTTGRSTGSAYVVMKEDVDGRRAVKTLHHTNFMNRYLVIYAV